MQATSQDIVDTLLAQHQQIKTLFAQVQSATGEPKEELFHELVALLAVHESVEESLVHPLAEDKLPDGGDVVPARLAEEQEAKEALAALYDLGVAHPEFDPRLAALRDAVTAHAEAEEAFEFIRLREVVDPDRLVTMASAMTAVAAMSPTRPHPGVPANPAANLLLGPPLAVFDRVRDAVRDATRGAR
ncbi:hemerythrin domain-containing protein [Luedemannella flava]|uniref:Hemerythrin domain-containing protein n=1 Tax=Luedemannella flava TaxID=349316 RepID=A0ABP4XGE8_9ACTN